MKPEFGRSTKLFPFACLYFQSVFFFFLSRIPSSCSCCMIRFDGAGIECSMSACKQAYNEGTRSIDSYIENLTHHSTISQAAIHPRSAVHIICHITCSSSLLSATRSIDRSIGTYTRAFLPCWNFPFPPLVIFFFFSQMKSPKVGKSIFRLI